MSVQSDSLKSDHPIISFKSSIPAGPNEKSTLNQKYRSSPKVRVYPNVDVANTDPMMLDHLTQLYKDLEERLPQSDVEFHPVTGHIISNTSLREFSRLMSTPNHAGGYPPQPYVDNRLQSGYETKLGRDHPSVKWGWQAYEFVLKRAIERMDLSNLPEVHSYPSDSALGPPFAKKDAEKVAFLTASLTESNINLLFSRDYKLREERGLMHVYKGGARMNQPDKLGKDGKPKPRPIRAGTVEADLKLFKGQEVEMTAPEVIPLADHWPVRFRLIYSANNFAQMPLAILWNIVRYAWKYGSPSIKAPTYATIAWQENKWRDRGLFTHSGDGSNWDGKVSLESMVSYENVMSRIFSPQVAENLAEMRMAPILVGASASGPGRWLCGHRWEYHEYRPGNLSGRMDVSALNDAVNFVNCIAAAKAKHPSMTMEDAWLAYRGESEIFNLILYGDDVLMATKLAPQEYIFPLCDLEMENGSKLVGSCGFLSSKDSKTVVRMNSAHSFIVNQLFKEGDAAKRMYPKTGFAAAKQVYSGTPDYEEILSIWEARVLADFGITLDSCFGEDKQSLNSSNMSDLVALYLAKPDSRHYMYDMAEIEPELAEMGIFMPHVSKPIVSFVYTKYGNL